jgi:DNA polymerase-3 subunit gamma/tau
VAQLRKIAGEEKVEIGDTSLHLIAREAEGSMRDAQSLLDQVLSFSGSEVSDQAVVEVLGVVDRQILQEIVQALGEGEPARLLQIVEAVHNYGYDLKEFCGELTRLMRDCLVLKVFPQAKERAGLLDLPEEEVSRLLPEVEKFSREELHSYFRAFLTAHDEIARSSFPRLILEMILTKLARRKPILSIQEVLEKLQTLETRLAGGKPVSLPNRKEAVKLPDAPQAKVEKRIPEEEEEDEEELAQEEERQQDPSEEQKEEAPVVSEANSKEESTDLSPDFERVWKEFVLFAKKKKPPFASLLEHGYPLVMNDAALEIGYPEKSFYAERMQEADNRTLLGSLAEEFFKKSIKVRVRGLSGQEPSGNGPGSGEREKAKKPSLRDKQEEALNHPLVREAVNIFGGRVVEIKNL